MGDIHPIFNESCGDDSGRHTLSNPWVRDGVRYATDGRILVWQKCNEPDTPDINPPNAELLIRDLVGKGKHESEPVTIPEFDFPPLMKTCDNCNGRGLCDKCECETEHECGACDGSGEVARSRVPIQLADKYRVMDLYLDCLRRHGATVYLPTHKARPAYFTIDGGIKGVVMPVDRWDEGD